MNDPIDRPVTKFTNSSGEDVLLNVYNIIVAIDELIFMGEPFGMDLGHRIPLDPQKGVKFHGIEGLQVSEISPMVVNRILENPADKGEPELLVKFEFSGPRVFQIFEDPDTLQTIVYDVTSKEPETPE